MAPFSVAVPLLVYLVHDNVERPQLTVMGVPAYLKVYSCSICLGKIIWLVVEHYDRLLGIRS
jgi:hypothetical protein